MRAVRKRLPDDVELMVDYNQALTFVQALERGRALDSEGVAWIEEPIRHDDFRNCAELARELATPIQIGENFSLPEQMGEARQQYRYAGRVNRDDACGAVDSALCRPAAFRDQSDRDDTRDDAKP